MVALSWLVFNVQNICQLEVAFGSTVSILVNNRTRSAAECHLYWSATLTRQKLVSEYIFPSSQRLVRQKPASLPPLSIKVFSISCPDYFFVNLSFTTPGQYGERNMLFPIIPDSMLSGRTAQGNTVVRENTQIQCAARYWPRDTERYQFL